MDLGFVASLFCAPARRLLVPAALCFHLAILVTLNYAFLGTPLLLLMVDWSSLVRRRAQAPSSGSAGSSTSAGSASGATASPS